MTVLLHSDVGYKYYNKCTREYFSADFYQATFRDFYIRVASDEAIFILMSSHISESNVIFS